MADRTTRSMTTARKVRRALFPGFVAFSLLLCIGLLVTWVRSDREGYMFGYASRRDTGRTLTWFYVARGQVWLGRMEQSGNKLGWTFESVSNPLAVQYDVDVPPGMRTGFGYMRSSTSSDMVGVVAPFWFLCLVSGVVPAWWAINIRRRRRAQQRSAGECIFCGYDLRATPLRCPECGAVVADSAAHARSS